MTNLDQFKQTYFDESAELLGVAEAGLLRLAPGQVDDDEVNAVFRAVHSIKGGAGAFGFTELVAFAHEFEAVMELVRSVRIPITTDLVDTLIRANDVLAQLVAYARDDGKPPDEFSAPVVEALRRFNVEDDDEADSAAERAPADPTPSNDTEGPETGLVDGTAGTSAQAAGRGAGGLVPVVTTPDQQTYTIVFIPKPDLLLSGNDPVFLMRALSRLGTIAVTCETGLVPPFAHLEPEHLFLSWRVRLTTDAAVAEIEDVFEFVSDESSLEITTEVASGDTDSSIDMVSDADASLKADSVEAAAASATVSATGTVATADRRRASGGDGGLAVHTIRVDLDKIDRLVNMVGEMVITQAMVAEHVRDLPPGSFQDLQEGLEQLAQHTRELRESVMSIRAQPVGSVFARMPRLVRELAGDTHKEVDLEMSGEATEVDKTVIENLVDPLTHMIRNSIDHGIESPEDRRRVGKSTRGTVHLSAQHRSGRIVIEVADDGRGIDRERVLAKAVQRGLIPSGSGLSDEEIDNLIFQPGFSTADKVTNISGRGVGMDVVRRNITNLGGRISVFSAPGKGSRFVLSLPLTLAVLDGMVISVGAERFVLPLTNIVESLRPRHNDLHSLVNRCDVMMARGRYVRLVYLHQLFGIPGAVLDPTEALVVLVEAENGERTGLVVDEVLGQQQVVIKSLEANFRRLDGVAAATILGDGRVALILDVAGVQDMNRRSSSGRARLLAAPPVSPIQTVEV